MRAQMLRHRLATGEPTSHLYDVNIALEHVRPPFFDLARLNVLVPNPEWLSPHSQRYLGRFDAILCKTEHARALFDAEGYPTMRIGFDSQDSHRPKVRKQRRFLHLAGASPMKGTRRLVALWERHPEWPALLVLQSGHEPVVSPHGEHANIEIRNGFIEDTEELRRLQNEHAFHVCLSETEGWGHYRRGGHLRCATDERAGATRSRRAGRGNPLPAVQHGAALHVRRSGAGGRGGSRHGHGR